MILRAALWVAFVALIFAVNVRPASAQVDPFGTPTPAPIATTDPGFQQALALASGSCTAGIGIGAPTTSGIEGILNNVTNPGQFTNPNGPSISQQAYKIGSYLWFALAGFSLIFWFIKSFRRIDGPLETLHGIEAKFFGLALSMLALQFAAGEGFFAGNGGTAITVLSDTASNIATKLMAGTQLQTNSNLSPSAPGGGQFAIKTPGDAFAIGTCESWKILAVPALSGLAAASATSQANANWNPVANAVDTLKNAAAGFVGMIPAFIIGLINGLLTLLVFLVIAFQLFLLKWSAIVLGGAALFLLGLSVFEVTAPWADSYWRFVSGNVLSQFTIAFGTIFVAALIDATRMKIMIDLNAFATANTGGPVGVLWTGAVSFVTPILASLEATFIILFCLLIVLSMPKLAGVFISGAGGLSAGDAIGLIGAASVAGVGGLVAAAKGLQSVARAMTTRSAAENTVASARNLGGNENTIAAALAPVPQTATTEAAPAHAQPLRAPSPLADATPGRVSTSTAERSTESCPRVDAATPNTRRADTSGSAGVEPATPAAAASTPPKTRAPDLAAADEEEAAKTAGETATAQSQQAQAARASHSRRAREQQRSHGHDLHAGALLASTGAALAAEPHEVDALVSAAGAIDAWAERIDPLQQPTRTEELSVEQSPEPEHLVRQNDKSAATPIAPLQSDVAPPPAASLESSMAADAPPIANKEAASASDSVTHRAGSLAASRSGQPPDASRTTTSGPARAQTPQRTDPVKRMQQRALSDAARSVARATSAVATATPHLVGSPAHLGRLEAARASTLKVAASLATTGLSATTPELIAQAAAEIASLVAPAQANGAPTVILEALQIAGENLRDQTHFTTGALNEIATLQQAPESTTGDQQRTSTASTDRNPTDAAPSNAAPQQEAQHAPTGASSILGDERFFKIMERGFETIGEQLVFAQNEALGRIEQRGATPKQARNRTSFLRQIADAKGTLQFLEHGDHHHGGPAPRTGSVHY